jgi:error-prone DNA polymerase
LKLVKGLSSDAAARVVAARVAAQAAALEALHPSVSRNATFNDISSLARAASLDARDLAALTSADALRGLSAHRRDAHWQALAIGKRPAKGLLSGADHDAVRGELTRPNEGEEIITDYTHLGFSLRRHPLALLRPQLRRHVTAEQLNTITSGARIRASGLVTCRQRPSTASGVVFVTLEDETGNINVVVWAHLVELQRKELLGASLLTVHGRIEKESGVIHLIAEKLQNDSHLLGRLDIASRDFH